MERHVLAALVGATWAFGAAADEVVLQPVRDNTLYQENAGNSNGAGYLFAGEQGGGSVRRALLRFDVAGAVPAGAQVAQVELNLHVSRAGFADPLPASLHRALADWGEAGSNAGERSGAGAPVALSSFAVTLDQSTFGFPGVFDIVFQNDVGAALRLLPTSQSIPGFTASLSGALTQVASIYLPSGAYYDNLSFEVVPEPGSVVLLGLGLAGLGATRRGARRRENR